MGGQHEYSPADLRTTVGYPALCTLLLDNPHMPGNRQWYALSRVTNRGTLVG
jgi:hypothetical protein